MDKLKKRIADAVISGLEQMGKGSAASPEDMAAALEVPPDVSMGDLALPCFRLSRALRMAPPILRSDRSRSFMQNRLSRCDNKVVAKVVIFRKTPTFAVLANGSAFGFFLFGTSRQNILCKHLQYLQMLCSYIFAAPYSQKSHTAARVAIFGSPVYRAYTNIKAANSPFLPKAARRGKSGAYSEKCDFRKRK